MEIRKDTKDLHDDTGKDIVIYFFRQVLFVRIEFIIKERSLSPIRTCLIENCFSYISKNIIRSIFDN